MASGGPTTTPYCLATISLKEAKVPSALFSPTSSISAPPLDSYESQLSHIRVLGSHVDFPNLKDRAMANRRSEFDQLNAEAVALAASTLSPIAFLAKHIHILPYFHGNRSPRFDLLLITASVKVV